MTKPRTHAVPAAILEAAKRKAKPDRRAPRVPVRKRPGGVTADDEEEASGRDYRFPETSPFYSRVQVLELITVTYPAVWQWMRDGKFPLPVEIGPGGGRRCRIGWYRTEVDEWVATRPRRVFKPRARVEVPA